MLAAVLQGPGTVVVEQVPDPVLVDPSDAIVRVVAACVCGSDLWPYRSQKVQARRIGHEFVGVIEEIGADVDTLRPGQLVIAPFVYSDGTCAACLDGLQTSCRRGGGWGSDDRNGHYVDAGQGQFVRVPFADGTLVAVDAPESTPLLPSLLALSDVMGTGQHAAVSAGVGPGSTAVVVGDGAVGLCAVLAASTLGAERIIALAPHADRAAVARTFGATHIVSTRGDEAKQQVRALTGGRGAAHVMECVGTAQSWATAFDVVQPGGTIGYVGVPAGLGDEGFPVVRAFRANVRLAGGVAPARRYLPDLLVRVLDGTLDPSPVFTRELPLSEIAEAYAAMDTRRDIKVLIRP